MAMNTSSIVSRVDHTLLKQTATWDQVRKLCDEGLQYKTASVCIPACYVQQAKAYVGNRLSICTVIGFPNGYSTTAAKCFEAQDAVSNGADEIDMVLNIGFLKAGEYEAVRNEIIAVKQACANRLLKVIIETCLLTEQEKIIACQLVSEAGADYIKTSTGFSTAGATREDIILLRRYTAPAVKIKAAGGIASLVDAADFIALGADRLGTSRVVAIVKQQEEGRMTNDELSNGAY